MAHAYLLGKQSNSPVLVYSWPAKNNDVELACNAAALKSQSCGIWPSSLHLMTVLFKPTSRIRCTQKIKHKYSVHRRFAVL